MTFDLPRAFVLFDLEYTAWEGSQEREWNGANEYREIIQIGVIKVSEMTEEDAFAAFVKPVKNPQLSDYISELTGITQKEVDEKGLSFDEAVRKFLEFVGEYDAYCWGRDIEVFEENAKLLDQTLTLPREQFHDLRPFVIPLLNKAGIDEKKYSSGTLIQAFGKGGDRAHDAVNDMRNLLEAMRELQEL